MINLAWLLYYYFRVETGWFAIFTQPELLLPMFVLYLYWFILFFFVGMYQKWFAESRFDELSRLFKITAVGTFILFFLILYDDFQSGVTSEIRFFIFVYWGILLVSVSFGRLLVRSIQRRLLINGIGRHNGVIVGFNPRAFKIHSSLKKHRALGIDIVAYLAVLDKNLNASNDGIKVKGKVEDLSKLIDAEHISEIIIALEKHEEKVLYKVIQFCDGKKVNIKIVPDLYEIISGQARTNQIYGFPLIDIMPQLMPAWEKKLKRIFDLVISFFALAVTFPMVILISAAIKLDTKGPVFYKQRRSGLNGKMFDVYKFRSMVEDAEKLSGPVWATKHDPRITRVGRIIRTMRLDEFPQFFNVLKGEMSLVGPRPERPFFVDQLAKEIPLYKRRLSVRPGITGWAQVKHKYDEDLDDVKMKVRYDLFYIENMSLRMDMKIIFRTIFIMLFGKGHFD
ncbi:MAG: sugar transferase [Melioribacteraceae bacterium]|nr:sugar transferase [Melioribacteraceae bacterium]MCF8264201.1 sugar transferase [Melioribacteraceae bacterium]MCF8431721.1 sugar transferase [Melioribacteraceae bacterium]